MLIRHKIILLFITFSGFLLCFFSAFIYLASVNTHVNSFSQRIKNKALATKDIYELNDKVAEKIITSIPDQSEYVFDDNNKLIFAINNLNDYVFDSSFFQKVQHFGEYNFSYYNPLVDESKNGYAFTFWKGNKKRTIVITAFNKTAADDLKILISILTAGVIIFLVAVGIAAYVFSIRTFRPVKDLVSQAEAVTGHNINFRLTYSNPNDEIGIVAASFNRVLDRVQALIESQKSFISYASHELRTPLAAVNGILETSLDYDASIEAKDESMRAARQEIQKATQLVNGLLQLVTIDSTYKIIEHTHINIVDILLDVISFYKLKKPSQEFSFEVPETPDDEPLIEVEGHEQLLRTAFVNLIDNASKYSGEKKIEIKLTIETGSIKIQIIDRGIGISQEEKSHVFEPFYRGKNANGFEGFGLGLALTRRIFLLHHSSLQLSKNDFSGVTAEIILPTA